MNDDLISRQALCKYALNQKDKSVTPNDIMRFPSAQPEHKKGKWILPNNPIAVSLNEWICSECNYLIDGKHNYCPNCGAKMEVEHDT